MDVSGYAFPKLDEPFRGALEDAVRFVVDRFAPIGILATGTIVRGNPAPASDLDLFVLWHRPERQRVQRFFRGVPAEIFVNPPDRISRYFLDDQTEGRPVTAHMFATGFIILDPTGVVAALKEAACQNLSEGPRLTEEALTSRRYAIATCFEDARDVASVDPNTGLALLHQAVAGALAFRFLSQPLWIPRFKDLLDRLRQVDSDLAVVAQGFYRATDPKENLRLAEEIVRRCVGETGFFEWETELERSSPFSPGGRKGRGDRGERT